MYFYWLKSIVLRTVRQVPLNTTLEFSQGYFRTELALSREADFGVAQIVPRYTFRRDRSLSELYVKTRRRRRPVADGLFGHYLDNKRQVELLFCACY